MIPPADLTLLPDSDIEPTRQVCLQRFLIVALLVCGISLLHYLTSTLHHPSHDIYRRLYYLPIVLGGLWFYLRGGVLVSLAVIAAYLPHVILQWKMHPEVQLEQYLELVMYGVIGTLTGYLALREHRQTLRYSQAAHKLQQSYEQLKQQADTILDIEDRLRRTERLSALGEMTAGLAHEIRNPLGSLRMAAEVVNDGLSPEDPRAEFGAILVKEGQRLETVLNDFLQFSKPEAGEVTEVVVADLLAYAQQLLASEGSTDAVHFDIECDPQWTVRASAGQLQQVVLNVMKNALEAMAGEGRLTVRCQRHENTLTLRLCDDGPGIDPSCQEQIFNPFFTTRTEGTGLGLSICARILQSYGGRISAANRPEGGACFTVELPIEPSGGQHARSRHSAH